MSENYSLEYSQELGGDKYSDLGYTTFPAQVDKWGNKSNLSADLYNLAKDYRKLCSEGDFAKATALLENNKELKDCMIDAQTINEMRDAIIAIERMWVTDIERYISKHTFDRHLGIQPFTHTYDSVNRIHIFSGDGLNGKVKITAPYHSGDRFAYNNTVCSAYMSGSELTTLFEGQYMYFIVEETTRESGDTIITDYKMYFMAGDITKAEYDADGTVKTAGGISNFVANTMKPTADKAETNRQNIVSANSKITEAKNAVDVAMGNINNMKFVEVTLTTNWNSYSGGGYYQDCAISGMTADWIPGTPTLVPYMNGSAVNVTNTNTALTEQLPCVKIIISDAGKLTFVCPTEKPTWNMTIRVPGEVKR